MRKKIQGAGVGLRNQHLPYIIENHPDIPWFELLADNYLIEDDPVHEYLDALVSQYPMVLHSVGMSIGSSDPLNQEYFANYKWLADKIKPAFVSDHVCWVSTDRRYFHDLLPLPFTQAIAEYVADRIQAIQDLIGYPLIVENVSSYLSYKESEMPEWEFMNLVAELADCGILLDLNNVYVSSVNHGFNAMDYIAAIDPNRVKQFHLAGYLDKGTHLVDTHGDYIAGPVWELYAQALKRFGKVPTLIEWDTDVPTFQELSREAKRAQDMLDKLG